MSAPLPLRTGYFAAAAVVRPTMNLLMRRQWLGTEHLPESGFILVANHVSELDPVAIAHMVYNHGNLPHFLAKAELFRIRGLGPALAAMRQIPVDRTRGGADSLETAGEVLAAGGAILIYPEGTVTRDPLGWPMKAKTGAARLALTTGVPVIPAGQWGVQDVLPRGATRPRLRPRGTGRISVGPAVPLEDLRAGPLTRAVLDEATERILSAITAQVERLRGESMPAGRYDPRTGDRSGARP